MTGPTNNTESIEKTENGIDIVDLYTNLLIPLVNNLLSMEKDI